MKTYPHIDGPDKAPRKPCYVFVKYDGSNIRAEWSKKRGWHKFGTRTQLLDETDPIFGRAPLFFQAKYGDDLAKVFTTEKSFRSIDRFTVFFEYFGSQSFGGMHYPDDPKWDTVLFDVNPHRKGILGPKEFLDIFGHLQIAELVCQCNMGEELIQNVRKELIDINSKYDVRAEIPEGVIVKGGDGSKHDLWMRKIKTERYKEELKKRYRMDWESKWE